MDLFTSVPLSLTAPIPFSILGLFGLLILGFSAGYMLRALHRNKSKKQMLKLEDEMLRNHAKILSLEKIISDLKRENNQLKNIYARRSKESQSQLH
ncbi:hypothetical protein [Dinghuibacter silviterrae]|uniref:Uncharacterized protein n=1 Tax=Dinghuibacter silviterrae TaxID=1539049 RepID=A0A4R8DQN0_9BACT|nr:hypothetical protein [Dinghuibacter silviterrae]TDW99430.1 hypothetical protein EDB95_0440 [Dinghuibacter silviterrae]